MAQDLTPLLYTTKSALLRQVLDRGGVVLGARAPGYKGILATDHGLTTSLADLVRHTGVEGFISTDELPKYGISVIERDAVEGAFHLDPSDTVILVAGPRSAAERAIALLEGELRSAPAQDSARDPDRAYAYRPADEPEPVGITGFRKIDPRRDIDIL